jgi:hypothetical protein
MRQDDDDDAFELIDGKKVLRDGKSVRVRLGDALTPLQRAVASRRQLTDEELASCRPGFRFAKDATLRDAKAEAKAKIYAAYDAEIGRAYLRPQGFGGDPRITGAGKADARLRTSEGATATWPSSGGDHE